MIDPAIIELMEHLTRPTPGLMREGMPMAHSPVSSIVRDIADGERDARAVEQEAADWIVDAERELNAVLEKHRQRGITSEALEAFPRMLERLDAFAKEEIREYERGAKFLRKLRKRMAASTPWFLEAFDNQSERVLRAMSRRNLALQDFVFALRAFHAQVVPAGARKEVYTDAKSLGAALRAAIA